MKLFHLTLNFVKHPPIELDARFTSPPRFFVHEGVEFVLMAVDDENSKVLYRERV